MLKTRKQTNTFGIWFGIGVIIAILAFIGWVANIIQTIMLMSAPITGTFILKVIGIFAFPLGSLLGWLGFF